MAGRPPGVAPDPLHVYQFQDLGPAAQDRARDLVAKRMTDDFDWDSDVTEQVRQDLEPFGVTDVTVPGSAGFYQSDYIMIEGSVTDTRAFLDKIGHPVVTELEVISGEAEDVLECLDDTYIQFKENSWYGPVDLIMRDIPEHLPEDTEERIHAAITQWHKDYCAKTLTRIHEQLMRTWSHDDQDEYMEAYQIRFSDDGEELIW